MELPARNAQGQKIVSSLKIIDCSPEKERKNSY
jgi:hypothetical protein